MSTTAVYSAPHQEIRAMDKKESKNRGKLIGSLAGAGVGGSYVASTIKDTLSIQNAKAIEAAKAVSKDSAPFLKASKRCVGLSAATVILVATALGTITGAIVDAIKNKKAQNPEK